MSPVTPDSFAQRFPSLAGSMEPADLETLLGAFEVHDAEAGEALVAQGTPSSDLFLVWDGRLDIVMTSAGAERNLARVEPGSYFGEVSLFDPGPAGASVVTEQGCVVLRLPRERFDELSRANPQSAAPLVHEVALSLGNRLAAASGRPAQPVPESLDESLSFGEGLAREFRAVAETTRERLAVGPESVTREYDVAVIGAGPHALAYATWIKQDRPETRIALVEKRRSPGFKIGESTLGPVIRAWMSLGIPLPAQRRLFNNKLGLHFWWTGEDTDDIHAHVDQVVEETYQVERRVLETLMMNVARRAGIDVYQGTKVLIEESRIHGQPKELVCEAASGDVLRLRSSVVCDASGPAAVVGRHLGIRRKNPDFNTNAYFGYFRKRSEVDLATWDVSATRHLCFPEGWVWFIELASWEHAGDEELGAVVDHLLDIGSPDEADYPTRLELADQFGAALEQFPVSIGVVPRSDIDTAADLPFEERFQHYVNRYPAFKRIMDTHELVESPYEGHPDYISYTDLVQHSERYAGDGWLLIGDAAYFVNPLYSPGMTYGHSLASFAARETVGALERGDLSEASFANFNENAAGLYSALATECEFFYRSFAHPDAFERAFMFRPAFFISLGHEKIQQFGGVNAMRHMFPMRPMGPPAEPIMNPRYQQLLRQVVDAARDLEDRGADPAETAKAVQRILGPVFEEIAGTDGVAALGLGEAFQNYDDRLERVPRKEGYESLTPTWNCPRCANRTPVEFAECYVCGEPAPEGMHRPAPAFAGPPGPPGAGPPGTGPPGAGPPVPQAG